MAQDFAHTHVFVNGLKNLNEITFPSTMTRINKPTKFNESNLKSIVKKSTPSTTVRIIAKEMGSNKSSVYRHLKEIGKESVMENIFLRNLMKDGGRQLKKMGNILKTKSILSILSKFR